MLQHVLVVIEGIMKSFAAFFTLEPCLLLVFFLVPFFVRFLLVKI